MIQFKMRSKTMSLFTMYALAVFIRFWLMTSDYQKVIADRVEVSTSLNAWKRIKEGLYLSDLDIYPYMGDFLHEAPLNLVFYGALVDLCGDYLYLAFIICDILTAMLLYIAATTYMGWLKKTESDNKSNYAKNIAGILLTEKDFLIPPTYVTAAFLFNPYSLLNCVGQATTVFSNFFLALFLVGMTNCSLLLSTLPLAVCISYSFYPVLLLSPLFLQFWYMKSLIKGILSVLLVVIFWLLVTYCSYCIYNNWDFITATYIFILTVPDFRPNMGLFWYFFIEMFEHFRWLFIYAFQMNATLLYLVPLSLRFRNDRMLLTTSLLSLTAIFKSYPCLGDVGFVLSLLPCWKHLFHYMQQGFLVGCCFYVTTALAPTVWYLWIYSGSANANFYFGATLAFATAQIFLITDILFAYVKREFTLRYGRVQQLTEDDSQLYLD